MIRWSTAQTGAKLNTTAVIAFDRADGRVYGIYIHASIDGWDEPGVKRNRYRLLTEIAEWLEYDVAGLDAVELPHDDLPRSGIERIDPVTRSVVPKIYKHKQATMPLRTRP